jgi:hypothetical protein
LQKVSHIIPFIIAIVYSHNHPVGPMVKLINCTTFLRHVLVNDTDGQTQSLYTLFTIILSMYLCISAFFFGLSACIMLQIDRSRDYPKQSLQNTTSSLSIPRNFFSFSNQYVSLAALSRVINEDDLRKSGKLRVSTSYPVSEQRT